MTLSRSEAPIGARDRRTAASGPRGSSTGVSAAPVHAVAAIAVAAIVLGHAGVGWLPGGGLGVDVLLVLAGFLMTTVLLDEIDRSGRVALAAFYRRALRVLGPAVVVVMGAVCAVSLFAAGETTTGALKGEALAALGSLSNWYAAATSMPVGLASGSLLQHLWPVAVVGQVVLVWPILVVGCMRLGGRERVRRVALTVAAASAVLMVILAAMQDVPGADATARVAFGTDTRVTGVLFGAALATVWTPTPPVSPLNPTARRSWDLVGTLALVGGVGVFVVVPEFAPAAFRGVTTLIGGLAVVVIAAATVPATRLGIAARAPLFGWLGSRVYALYLWHWPVLAAGRQVLPFDGAAATVLALATIAVLADLTYRYVERPLRDGAVARLLDRLRWEEGATLAMLRRRVVVTSSAVATVVVVVAAGMAMTPSAALAGAADDGDGGVPAEPEPPPVDCAVEACVALTFDDGPGPHTGRLLDDLDDLDVTATFFMLGAQVERFPDIVRQVHEAGHEIGAHTFGHPDLLSLEPEEAAEEIRSGAYAITEVVGAAPTLVRPPYGSTDSTILDLARQEGLAEVLWDVDTLDWKYRDPDAIVTRALDEVKEGSIVLLHDIRPTTVDAVPDLIGGLREAGFVVVPVGTLLEGLLEPGTSYGSRPSPETASPTPSPGASPGASSQPSSESSPAPM